MRREATQGHQSTFSEFHGKARSHRGIAKDPAKQPQRIQAAEGGAKIIGTGAHNAAAGRDGGLHSTQDRVEAQREDECCKRASLYHAAADDKEEATAAACVA